MKTELSTDDIVICVDTREPQTGAWADHFTLPTVRACLTTGDYSVLGAEDLVCIERKALPDLIACFCGERERFTRELARFRAIPARWIIVEGSYSDLLNGSYRSMMNPKAAFESCIALMVRFQIPVIMANDVETAARLAQSLLVRWVKEHHRVTDTIRKASAEALKATG
jgi:ERCC4-type nuclease